MITDQDISKLMIAWRRILLEEAATKKDLQDLKDELKADFNTLQKSVDNFARTVERHDKEIIIINHRLDKLENPA